MRRALPGERGEASAILNGDAELLDGVWRWRSNGNVPPDDFLALAGVGIATRASCDLVRDDRGEDR